jgi:tetratricopeptide (TPR) repeat protein
MILGIPQSFAFSSVGLRNALDNCLNKNVSSPERIEACNNVIHTNILLPAYRARVIASRGNAYFAEANLDNALEDYSKALELNPGLTAALTNRTVTLVKLGKCEEAASDLTSVLASDPRSWRALYGRSVCEAKVGEQERSQSDLAAATAINPNAAQEFAPDEIARWYQ